MRCSAPPRKPNLPRPSTTAKSPSGRYVKPAEIRGRCLISAVVVVLAMGEEEGHFLFYLGC